MTAPLREVVLRSPGETFGRAFDDPAHGFLFPVDLDAAKREHAALAELLTTLGVKVHVIGDEGLGPDSVYVFDPLLVTDRGAVPLRPGKPTRLGEEPALERWTTSQGIPTLGRIAVHAISELEPRLLEVASQR